MRKSIDTWIRDRVNKFFTYLADSEGDYIVDNFGKYVVLG